eukprot:Seg1146.7 transcript_id=Seg1146.7/GoldUCD/mRNA.D3Y31 product="LINE-1 reverse transcriptase" protein_id=Seg1146.7/GoldUCD/D3Y31
MASREPKNSLIREVLHDTKKSFKKLVNNKKFMHRSQVVEKMQSASKNDSKHFWKLLESLKNQNESKTDYVQDIGPENWISMFQNLLNDSNCVSCEDPIDNSDLSHDEYLSREITQQGLIAAVKKLKTGKASGLDQVLNEMIICGADRYSLAFVNLFNNLLKNGIFPSSWTRSMIVPLHKRGTKTLETNYRGIAILSCLGKFFNVIINDRISEFVK